MDLSMIQTLLSTVGEALPKYMQAIEEEFRQENGTITEEQQKVFDFVQKKAKDFITQVNPMGQGVKNLSDKKVIMYSQPT